MRATANTADSGPRAYANLAEQPHSRGGDRCSRGFVKATLALGAIAAIGAGIAMTGAGAAPSVAPERPTVDKGTKVVPAVFRHSVKSLPQLGPSSKDDIKKPRAWEKEFEPSFGKTPPSGSVEPTAPATVPDAPAPPPGGGGDPYAGTFLGLDFNAFGAGWPPDTNGDVGPAHYIQAVNTSIGIFRKTDGVRLAAFTFDSLWTAPDGTLCDNDNGGDPTVTYDPIGDRWFVADFAFSGSGSTPPFYECIAVSRTGDPVNGGWYFYAIRADDATHPWFPDYPKMGIWPDGLYMTANMFQTATRSARFAAGRSTAPTWRPARRCAPSSSTRTRRRTSACCRATCARPPGRRRRARRTSSSPSRRRSTAFEVFKFHVDYSGSGSTFTGPTNVTQANYTVASATVPSPGTASTRSPSG